MIVTAAGTVFVVLMMMLMFVFVGELKLFLMELAGVK